MTPCTGAVVVVAVECRTIDVPCKMYGPTPSRIDMLESIKSIRARVREACGWPPVGKTVISEGT